jgi:hypothetical protein
MRVLGLQLEDLAPHFAHSSGVQTPASPTT